MALIGVFGLNTTRASGGTYHLIHGLMEHAQYSQHRYVYIHERTRAPVVFPPNVQSVAQPGLRRFCAQGLCAVPFVDLLLSREAIAFFLLGAVSGIPRGKLRGMDAWLWPHCCSPVPHVTPVVAIFHDMIHRHHPEWFSPAIRLRRRRAEISMRHCAAVLCPSQAVRADLVGAYPGLKDRTTVCWEAACEVVAPEHCESEIRAIRSAHGTAHLFLYVAADWPHKNHELLIDAALDLRKRTAYPFKLVLVGPRRSHRLQRLIQERQATDVVADVGSISRRQLAGYYYAATSLVYSSRDEGFGIPLVEAMRCGTPIIASDAGSIPEVCGQAAVLLPPREPHRWAAEMLRMATEPEHRARCSQAARERGALFTWNRCWETIDRVLSAVTTFPRDAGDEEGHHLGRKGCFLESSLAARTPRQGPGAGHERG